MRNFEGTPAHTVYSVVKETFNLAILDRMDILYLDRVKTKKNLDINLDGQVVAAVNMPVNADPYDRSAVETTLIPAVISGAARISKALGYHP